MDTASIPSLYAAVSHPCTNDRELAARLRCDLRSTRIDGICSHRPAALSTYTPAHGHLSDPYPESTIRELQTLLKSIERQGEGQGGIALLPAPPSACLVAGSSGLALHPCLSRSTTSHDDTWRKSLSWVMPPDPTKSVTLHTSNPELAILIGWESKSMGGVDVGLWCGMTQERIGEEMNSIVRAMPDVSEGVLRVLEVSQF